MTNVDQVRVFVSCPGDVTPEKEIIKKVCKSLNHDLQRNKVNVNFEVLDFKDIVGTWGGRPQEEINVRFKDYDIYIGLLWMRFGSPSGGSDPQTGKPFESGTEEEFSIAKTNFLAGANIKIYFFFKDPRATRGKEEVESLLKIENFKEDIQAGWYNTIPSSEEFPFRIYSILNDFVFGIRNNKIKAEKEDFLLDIEYIRTDVSKINIDSFTKHAVVLEDAIKRTVSQFDQSKEISNFFAIERHGEDLRKVVEKQSRIVLLGNAGSGKSTELANLAKYFTQEDSIFVSVFQKMNTYVDENLEDFLPVGWEKIPESTCLVILDGLDEIQPSNFNTAIRKISTFFARHPEIKSVISCRTNFYELPTSSSPGTLADFSVYFIDDIDSGKIENFVKTHYSVNAHTFLDEVEQNGFRDLVAQPFFLQVLLQKYKDKGDLNISKVVLLNDFIEERFDFDEKHFTITNPLRDKKGYVMRVLKKVALTMEYMGTNHISSVELQKVLPNPDDIELLRFSTAFKNDAANPSYWSFEHNNIQEFLAASVLEEMDVEQIKKSISFNEKRIRPSWINTLFFLMGIIDSRRRDILIEWILDIEPEILVKIEPNKVDSKTRFKIFKDIFEHYKKLDVWIDSNKFTRQELSRFPDTELASNFLLEELSHMTNSIQARLNAMDLIKHQKLNSEQERVTKNVLMDFINEKKDNAHIINATVNTLTNLGLGSAEVLEYLMSLFATRKNQYIRASIYKMIRAAKLENFYIDYLIEGISIPEKGDDREETMLLDEYSELVKLLDADLSINSLKKLLSLLKENSAKSWYFYDYRYRLLNRIVADCANAYKEYPEFYNLMFNIYINYGQTNDLKATSAIVEFFEKTGNKLKAYKELYYNTSLLNYQKAQLYVRLLDKNVVDYLISEYNSHDMINKELYDFYQSVKFYSNAEEQNNVQYLEQKIKENSDILNNIKEIDYKELKLDYDRQNLSLYFEPEDVRKEIISFFERNNIDELDWSTLYSYKKYDFTEKAELGDASFDLLTLFLRQRRQLTIDNFLKYTEDTQILTDYLFRSLKEKLSQQDAINITKEQNQKLQIWVTERASTTNIKNAIKVNEIDRNKVKFDILAQTLWFYIEKFDLSVETEKILDFTTFDDPANNSRNSLHFAIIEKQVGTENMQKRIVSNLRIGIDYDIAWVNNAIYALNNGLQEAYDFIDNELANAERPDYYRSQVLEVYQTTIKDTIMLLNLLDRVKAEPFRWKLIRILFENEKVRENIINLLREIMVNKNEDDYQKFTASHFLTKAGDFQGTKFYLDFLIANSSNVDFDYIFGISSLVEITDPLFLPQLMQLYKIGRIAEENDEFNRLSSAVAEVLLNLALASENNLQLVKKNILEFIEGNSEKIKDIKYMHAFIERMEFQFYLSKSQIKDVNIALEEVSKILTFGI